MSGNDYTFLGLITLDGGSWADWFAGTMSLAAVGAAFFGYWTVHRQRLNDERDREKRAAETVGWKALRVYNDTATIAKHLKSSLEADFDPVTQRMRFSRVRPLGVPLRSSAELTQEEISVLLRAKATSLLMNLSDAILRYDSIRFAMQEYGNRHQALFELMPDPVHNKGTYFTHELGKDEQKRVLPYAAMLESLLNSLIELVAEGISNGDQILEEYGNSMKTYFKEWHLAFEGNQQDADLTIFQDCPVRP